MDKQNLVLKYLFLFFVMGMIYFTLEGFWNGKANIIMLPVGGICSLLIGLLNEYPQYYSLKIYQQSLIGTLIVLVIEFASGIFFNVYLNLNLWNYSDTWGNLYGQICIPYALLWFILVPFCIWLDDFLRFKSYNEGELYSLKEIYLELLRGK
jgi:uncharacterized membrane protein